MLFFIAQKLDKQKKWNCMCPGDPVIKLLTFYLFPVFSFSLLTFSLPKINEPMEAAEKERTPTKPTYTQKMEQASLVR